MRTKERVRPERAMEILSALKLESISEGYDLKIEEITEDTYSHWENYINIWKSNGVVKVHAQSRYIVNLNGRCIIHPEKTITNFLKKVDTQSELEFLIEKAVRQNLDKVHDCYIKIYKKEK